MCIRLGNLALVVTGTQQAVPAADRDQSERVELQLLHVPQSGHQAHLRDVLPQQGLQPGGRLGGFLLGCCRCSIGGQCVACILDLRLGCSSCSSEPPSLVIQTVYSLIYFLYDQCKPVRVSPRSSLVVVVRWQATLCYPDPYSLDQNGWRCTYEVF